MQEKDLSTVYEKYGGRQSMPAQMGLVDKIKKVILSPSEFFEAVRAERGVGTAFKYLAILSLINLVVGILGYVLSIPSISPLGNLVPFLPELGTMSGLVGIGTPIMFYIIALIGSFIGAAIIHLFARLLKGKGDYSATYKALTYANTPSLLLGWVPWVGIIFGLYSFYLGLKGISKLHNVSMIRAFVILFVIPFVIAFILSVALAGLVYVWLISVLSGG